MTRPSDPHRPGLSRRRFLQISGGLGLVAASPLMIASAHDRLSAAAVGASAPYVGGQPRDLILVTIQLEGGLDQQNTLVPLADARYRDFRGAGAIEPINTDPLDDTYGLFAMPYLAGQWAAGNLAVVRGVGYPSSTLSHFSDTDVWHKGSLDLSTPSGWLGRSLGASASDVDPIIGISIGELSPAMYGEGWNPVALPEGGGMPWSRYSDEIAPELRPAFEALSAEDGDDGDLAAMARRAQRLVMDTSDRLDDAVPGGLEQLLEGDYEDPEEGGASAASETDRYFGGERAVTSGFLGSQMSLVAELINAGMPTRAFHVMQGGYDTHGNQEAVHPVLVHSLDKAIGEFYARLGSNADRVIVATYTEFGRTPHWNGSGTDHGTAGLQFVVGSRVIGGLHGEDVSFDDLDRDGNFKVTGDFRDYLGGMAQGVLGADARRVLDSTNPMQLIA